MTTTPTVTAGFIYPDHAAEDEYPWAAELLGVQLPVAHVYGTDLHAVPELLDLGRPDRLAEGAADLARHAPQSVMWACTSGSFVYGPEGSQEQIDQLAQAAGVPASSTSAAFVAALASLGLTRVAVAASYPQDVAALFVEYLAAAGIEVLAMGSADIDTAAEVGRLSDEQVIELALAHDHPQAQTLLVPDTAMRTLAVIPDLETRLGKPVLTANQVSIWQALRLAGARPTSSVLGLLFSRRQDHARQ